MARVRLNDVTDVQEEHRAFFERLEQGGGMLNIFRALSHSPEAMRRFMRFGSYLLNDGKLDPRLRELAILRTGALCRSPYEFSQHIAFGRRVGLTDDEIRAVQAPHSRAFAPQDMAVLAYASEMTSEARVSPATYDTVAAFLNDEQIVELTLVVGFYNLVSRTLNALEVDVDDRAAADLKALGVEL